MSDSWLIHIVDDDAPVRMALQFALQVIGFRVEAYADAGDFRARRADGKGVLICDVRMPGTSGIELAADLRLGGSTMPIILMTGHASRALHSEARAAGADALLEKPAELNALVAEIKRLTFAQDGNATAAS